MEIVNQPTFIECDNTQLDLNCIQYNALLTGPNNFRFANGTIGDIVSVALPYVFFLAGILFLLYFILAGYRWMFSGGDPKAVADSKGRMTYAIIGFLIVFGAYWIVQFAGQFLGLDEFQGIFGNQ